jgi:tetratricopeptide (TPR) repeat protein
MWKLRNSEHTGKSIIYLAVVVFAGIIVYSNTFHVPFQWDEDAFIRANPLVKNIGYFFKPSRAGGHELYAAVMNRYIGYLTFALNYKINGFDVVGYHVFNVFVHILNAVLVFFLVVFTFRTPCMRKNGLGVYSERIAFFSALVFVSHPIQTEAVTYIFQRLASLMTTFYLFALLMYARGRLIIEGRGAMGKRLGEKTKAMSSRPWALSIAHHLSPVTFFSLSFLSAVLAMKTKENAFTLPVMAAIYEFVFFRGPAKRRILLLLPLLLTLLIVPLSIMSTGQSAAQVVRDTGNGAYAFSHLSSEDYLFTQFRVLVGYLRLFLFPVNQNLDYDVPILHSLFLPQVFLSFLFLATIFGAAVYLLYKARGEGREAMPLPMAHNPSPMTSPYSLIGFGIVWFFVTISVESSVVPIPTLMDEYRMYLPSAGLIIASVTALHLLYEKVRARRKARAVVLCVVVALPVIFSAAAYARNSVWGSRISLWQDTVLKSPGRARARYGLGFAYSSEGMFDRALTQYEIAVKLDPDYATAYNALGAVYWEKGLSGKAAEQFRLALRVNPDLPEAHLNLGNIFYNEGEIDSAIEQYEAALKLKPDLAAAHSSIANAYYAKGLVGETMGHFQIAAALMPDNADAHFNLARICLETGDVDTARAEFRKVIALRPDDSQARRLLESLGPRHQ